MDRQLINYLPYAIREFTDFQGITTGEQPEFELAWNYYQEVFDNQFIDTAGDYGVRRWEKMLNISPKGTDTLEDRKARIKILLTTKTPFTVPWLKSWLTSICGPDGHKETIEDYIINLQINYDSSDKKNFTLEILNILQEIIPANMYLWPVNAFRPIPFVETPGHLIFRRFILSWAFVNYRGGYRFNGIMDFSGGATCFNQGKDEICFDGSIRYGDGILFDQGSTGMGFPRFQINSRFAHFRSGITFDGATDFNGETDFDQAFGVMGFPSLQISGNIGKNKEQLFIGVCNRSTFSNKRGGLRFDGLPPFDGSILFDNDGGGVRFKQYAVSTGLKHSEQLSGKITLDNWLSFDGEAAFDNSRTFNAYIKEEEL